MTPAQISLVEQTIALVDIDELTRDFYSLAFAAEPALTTMFTSDPHSQRERFAAELAEIVRSIRTVDTFATEPGRSESGITATAFEPLTMH